MFFSLRVDEDEDDPEEEHVTKVRHCVVGILGLVLSPGLCVCSWLLLALSSTKSLQSPDSGAPQIQTSVLGCSLGRPMDRWCLSGGVRG